MIVVVVDADDVFWFKFNLWPLGQNKNNNFKHACIMRQNRETAVWIREAYDLSVPRNTSELCCLSTVNYCGFNRAARYGPVID